jgi:hypothetical protein
MSAAITTPPPRRIRPWRRAVGIGHTCFYSEVARGKIEVAKVGNATIVITTPEQYLASLRRGVGSTNSARAVAARKAARAAS